MKSCLVLLIVVGAVICAPKCKKNEEMVPCHNHCEPQCGFTPTDCSKSCIANTCDCKKGFVRNTKGDCVDSRECTAETTKCGRNEIFRACGTNCEPTCEKPSTKGCSMNCVMNKCQCDDGMVRHGKNCIPLKDCPKM